MVSLPKKSHYFSIVNPKTHKYLCTTTLKPLPQKPIKKNVVTARHDPDSYSGRDIREKLNHRPPERSGPITQIKPCEMCNTKTLNN